MTWCIAMRVGVGTPCARATPSGARTRAADEVSDGEQGIASSDTTTNSARSSSTLRAGLPAAPAADGTAPATARFHSQREPCSVVTQALGHRNDVAKHAIDQAASEPIPICLEIKRRPQLEHRSLIMDAVQRVDDRDVRGDDHHEIVDGTQHDPGCQVQDEAPRIGHVG